MRSIITIFCGALVCILFGTPLLAAATSSTQQDSMMHKLAGMQIPFVENKGQAEKSVAFYAPTFSGTLFVTKNGELVYALPAGNDAASAPTTQVLVERFVAGKPAPSSLHAAPTKISHFNGNDREQWQRDISTHSALSLGEVWPGIDVALYAYGKKVEKFFTVLPGASVDAIRVQLDGAQALRLNKEGMLEVLTESGVLQFTAPVAWQEKAGKKLPVQVAYVVQAGAYGFKLGEYDAGQAVVIDPLLQSTYLGGANTDSAYSITIHPVTGEVYVAGTTGSLNFPGATGGAQAVKGGVTDVFVSRLNSGLNVLLQSTYLGGNGNDFSVNAIAVHPVSGEVYIAGNTTSTNFPGVTGGAQAVKSGGSDAFLTRLSSNLNTLLQSTHLGGSGTDDAKAIAIHPVTGEVYVAGNTASANFPGVVGGAQAVKSAGSDAFVARLNSNLSTLLQSSYLGGSGAETVYALAVHPITGEVYAAGYTASSNLPGVTGSAQAVYGGANDGFTSRLNSNLSILLQSTYLGGSGAEIAYSLAIHPVSGEIYVGGYTQSTNFPGVSSGVQAVLGGGKDAFVAHLSADLVSLLQSSYLGGTGDDTAYSLGINATSGDVYVSGNTGSSDFPGASGGAQAAKGGASDSFVARLNGNLNGLLQSSYLGGVADDTAYALAIHSATGEVYVAGYTGSADLLGIAGGAQTVYAGGVYDAFVSRLTPSLALNDYTLTAAKSGTGTGTVSTVDGRINCGSDCSEVYGNNLSATLSAAPDINTVFAGWSGACSNTSGDCVVTMDADKTVTATFNTNTYPLTISKAGSGTGTVTSSDGLINCGADCTENYAPGALATLTATADVGSTFLGWSGECVLSTLTLTCTATMDAAKSVTATFSPAEPTVCPFGCRLSTSCTGGLYVTCCKIVSPGQFCPGYAP